MEVMNHDSDLSSPITLSPSIKLPVCLHVTKYLQIYETLAYFYFFNAIQVALKIYLMHKKLDYFYFYVQTMLTDTYLYRLMHKKELYMYI